MHTDIIKALVAPFPFDAVEAKIQVTSGDKNKGMAVFYLDSRAIQKRLDEAVGALNWSNDFSTWHNNAQICGISIYNETRGEWVTKHDGAENSDIEPIKGGLTDAFKRAAVLWGIGRYLYQIEGCWVEIEQRGKGSYIKDNQKSILKSAYDAAVKKIFSTVPQAEKSTQATKSPNAEQAAPPAPQTTTSNKAPAPAAAQKSQTNALPIYEFKVHSVKQSGKSSKLLELCDNKGEITEAYVKADQSAIEIGMHLRNVTFEIKTGTYGKYSLLSNYELAAA